MFLFVKESPRSLLTVSPLAKHIPGAAAFLNINARCLLDVIGLMTKWLTGVAPKIETAGQA